MRRFPNELIRKDCGCFLARSIIWARVGRGCGATLIIAIWMGPRESEIAVRPTLFGLSRLQASFSPRGSTGCFWIAVSLPALLAVFGSRWLSQLTIGPFYLLDPLLASASLVLLVSLGNPIKWGKKTQLVFLLLAVVPTLSLLRTPWTSLSEPVLRDFYPFVALIYAALLAAALMKWQPKNLRPVSISLTISLVAHWMWVSAVMLSPGWRRPLGKMFEIRPDVDGTLLGVLAGLVFLRSLQLIPFLKWMGVIFSTGLMCQVVLLNSRAAYIAGILIILAVALKSYLGSNYAGKRKPGALLLLLSPVIVLSLMFSLIGPSDTGPKLIGLIEISSSYSQNILPRADTGTTVARIESWTVVGKFFFESPKRVMFGEGFGSDYFRSSGGLEALVGEGASRDLEATRHPHNALFHVANVMGLPVALFLTGLFGWGIKRGLTLKRNDRGLDAVSHVALSLLVGLSFSSLVGVVFEGPYGIIPLSWALGFLIGYDSSRNAGAARVV